MSITGNTGIDKTLRGLTGYQLQRANGAGIALYKAVFAKFGLRRTTFSCLSLIVENPGLQQGQLAAVLAIERSNIVQIIDDLSKKDLILREPAKTDRRAYALTATEKGVSVFKAALQAVKEIDDQVNRGLSKEELLALEYALRLIETNSSLLDP